MPAFVGRYAFSPILHLSVKKQYFKVQGNKGSHGTKPPAFPL